MTGASTGGKPWIGVEADSHAQSAASRPNVSVGRVLRKMPIGGLPVPGPSLKVWLAALLFYPGPSGGEAVPFQLLLQAGGVVPCVLCCGAPCEAPGNHSDLMLMLLSVLLLVVSFSLFLVDVFVLVLIFRKSKLERRDGVRSAGPGGPRAGASRDERHREEKVLIS